MKRSFKKHRLTTTLVIGMGIGLSGCQTPSLGGLAFWKGSSSSAPDVGKQKFDGLSQQLAGSDSKSAAAKAGSTPLGAPRPAEDNMFMASWKKTTAAVTGAVTPKPKINAPEDDPLRLDKLPKKIGPEVYIGAARLLENQGKVAEAEEKYLDALKAAPNDLTALVGLARLYDRSGQGAKAIEMYQRAQKAHPSSSLVANDLGLSYLRQKQVDKSIQAFRTAAELQPDNPKYRNNLAAALLDEGRDEEALRELRVTNAPAGAHFNLAFLLQERGRKSDAAQHLQQALALEPGLAQAQEMLAQLGGQPALRPAFEQRETVPPMAARIATREAPAIAPAPAYGYGATGQSVYTAAPKVATPAAAQSTYHIGDDAGSSAQSAQRTDWGAAAGASELKLLPPTE